MRTRSTSIFKDQHFVFPVASQYVDCLMKELGINNLLGNPTYAPMTLTKKKILDYHMPVFFIHACVVIL